MFVWISLAGTCGGARTSTDPSPVTRSNIYPWPHCLPGVLPSNNTDCWELKKIVQRLQSIVHVY